MLELVFAAPPMSEQMFASAASSMSLVVESKKRDVQTDADATAWLREWVGDYRCKELGAARIRQSTAGYRADFESWGSELGVETQRDGGKRIVLTSPPWSGSLRLQGRAETN